jgi:hypothetical protein
MVPDIGTCRSGGEPTPVVLFVAAYSKDGKGGGFYIFEEMSKDLLGTLGSDLEGIR